MSTTMSPGLWDSMWARLANPWTIWTRVALAFVLFGGVWMHSWPVIAVVTVALVTNPWWFSPREAHGMLGRMIAGARLWMEQSPALVVVPLALLGTALFAGLLWALWTHQVALTVVLFGLFVAMKAGFFVHFATMDA